MQEMLPSPYPLFAFSVPGLPRAMVRISPRPDEPTWTDPTASQSPCQQEMADIDTCVPPGTTRRYKCSLLPFQVPISIAAGRARLLVPAISQDVMLEHEIGPRVVPAGRASVRSAAGRPAELIFTR